MTTGRRILDVGIAILMIAGAVLIVFRGNDSLKIVTLILSVALLAYGIGRLVYYFSMARFMVGGRMMFYLGVLAIDAAIFGGTMIDNSPVFLMLCLIIAYVAAALFDLLHALEARKMESPSWKRTMVFAVGNLIIAAVCAAFLRSGDVAAFIFAGGLVYSAIQRIIGAFRKTAVLYITN